MTKLTQNKNGLVKNLLFPIIVGLFLVIAASVLNYFDVNLIKEIRNEINDSIVTRDEKTIFIHSGENRSVFYVPGKNYSDKDEMVSFDIEVDAGRLISLRFAFIEDDNIKDFGFSNNEALEVGDLSTGPYEMVIPANNNFIIEFEIEWFLSPRPFLFVEPSDLYDISIQKK